KNVFVWLAPPDGHYFKVGDAEKKSAKDVEIDQPHCAFIPHAAVAFTHYYDGKALQITGQKVLFKNSSKSPHNTNYKGVSFPGRNKTLAPGDAPLVADDMKPEKGEIIVSCEIHTWMRAFIRDFDHPYAAVTDENGNFEIQSVPTGVPVQLVTWHEKGGY